MLRKILLGLLAALILIQFIRPARNRGVVNGPKSLAAVHPLPPAVEAIMSRACYDCHSNSTRYPWYSNIQPFGWWLQHHVDEGKESLNFSEWATYKREDMPHVMDELREEVEEGHMPLDSYLWMHSDAKLSAAERSTLIAWARAYRVVSSGSSAL